MTTHTEAITRLREHHEATGDINLPAKMTLDIDDQTWRAGLWLHRRRQDYRDGKLDQKIVEALDDMGFTWEPRQPFSDAIARLCRYCKEGGGIGDLTRKSTLIMEDGSEWKAGVWLGSRRQEHRRGTLNRKTASALGKLGFDWNPGPPNNREVHISLLRRYCEEGGDIKDLTISSSLSTEDGQEWNIGRWLDQCRKSRRKGELRLETISILDEMGFDWNPGQKRRR